MQVLEGLGGRVRCVLVSGVWCGGGLGLGLGLGRMGPPGGEGGRRPWSGWVAGLFLRFGGGGRPLAGEGRVGGGGGLTLELCISDSCTMGDIWSSRSDGAMAKAGR